MTQFSTEWLVAGHHRHSDPLAGAWDLRNSDSARPTVHCWVCDSGLMLRDRTGSGPRWPRLGLALPLTSWERDNGFSALVCKKGSKPASPVRMKASNWGELSTGPGTWEQLGKGSPPSTLLPVSVTLSKAVRAPGEGARQAFYNCGTCLASETVLITFCQFIF